MLLLRLCNWSEIVPDCGSVSIISILNFKVSIRSRMCLPLRVGPITFWLTLPESRTDTNAVLRGLGYQNKYQCLQQLMLCPKRQPDEIHKDEIHKEIQNMALGV